MNYFEAPNTTCSNGCNAWEREYKSIFLAGGITKCVNWQKVISEKLERYCVNVLNPRRDRYPMDDSLAMRQQINWEYHMLKLADVIAFWFSNETEQPIALFELGRWLGGAWRGL